MRQSLRLNRENQQLMDGLLYQVTRFFPHTGYGLPFIGSILYLKKKGANLIGDFTEETLSKKLSEYDALLSEDSLRDVILEVMSFAAKSISCSKLDDIFKTVAISEFDGSEYLFWYDYAIENVSRQGKESGQFVVPQGLTDLAQAFICGAAKKTFVPFGGVMNFATRLEGFEKLESYELHRETWLIGMLRIGLGDVVDKCNFVCRNLEVWPSERYDAIVSMPPFGMHLNMKTAPKQFRVSRVEDSELVAPCRFIESTTDTGICVAFGPTSLLWGGSSTKKFRIWAMKEGVLDTIILLPGNMLNGTNIPLACIILRKKPFHHNAVRMIDASGIYTNHQGRNLLEVGKLMNAYHTDTDSISRTVSYDEIESLDYSWNVRHYFLNEQECPEGYMMKSLEDIIEMPFTIDSTKRVKGLVIKASNLSDDWTRPYIILDNLSKNYHQDYIRLDQTAVVLSTDKALNPSIIKASEECPVWISPNLLAIIPHEDIDPEYLCMTLAKINVPTIGLLGPRISKTFLLRQKIAYPEVAMQKNLYREASREKALAKVQELGLHEVINQMKADYMNEVRARKHDMKTPMTQLRNSLTLIKELAKELPDEFSSRLEKYVNRQQKAMDILSDIVSHIADEDQFAIPEVVDIEDILKSFERITDKYTIEYHRDETSLKEASIETPYLKIGKVDFVRLSQNIVSNAVKRGFARDNTEYALHITLSVENEFFVIDFSNNGEPLPEGMDKVRYGTKGAKGANSDGSGTGGYIVKSITQHYGGDFEIFSTKFANMDFTHVIVKLPIYREEDE